MGGYVKVMRPKQWIKNFIILLPVFFRRELTFQIVFTSALAFASFCMLASAVYVVNDIFDCEKDRQHPVKCNRPIAAGLVSIGAARVMCAVLVALSFVLMLLAKPEQPILTVFIFVAYFGLNVFYSLRGKDIPILDITILASGYLFRLLYGSCICGIEVSPWLYLTIVTGSFYLRLGKRRNELRRIKASSVSENTRAVYKYYTYEFLDKNMYLCMAAVVTFYSLWCANHWRMSNELLWTVPLALVIMMKYNLTLEKSIADGDPTTIILSDKVLLGLALLFAISLFVILYIL